MTDTSEVERLKNEVEFYKQGWLNLTRHLRDRQRRHLDNHDGDVYHLCQSLASKFGLRESGPLIGPIDAPQTESTNHPDFSVDPLGYYRSMALMGTAASYVLECERGAPNAFHYWIALWEKLTHFPEQIQRAFMEERIIVSFTQLGDKKEYELGFYIQCNDLFYWACSDAEHIQESEFPDLLRAYEESPKNGELLWCARKRGMRPQWPYYKYFSEAEHALFNVAGPERTDEDGKQQ